MMRRVRLAAMAGIVLALAACQAQPVWAPDEAVQAAAFRADVPPTVTLMTMVNNQNGSGGHSALMIDGAQRVLFDPAGSWYNPAVPERNDVLFGMTPPALDLYTDYHARETYHIVVQELEVAPEVANYLIQQVQANGAVPMAQCALSISTILSRAPGFEGNIRRGWYPLSLMDQFGALPGVRTSRIYDDDSDDNLELLQAQARAAQSREIAAQVGGD